MFSFAPAEATWEQPLPNSRQQPTSRIHKNQHRQDYEFAIWWVLPQSRLSFTFIHQILDPTNRRNFWNVQKSWCFFPSTLRSPIRYKLTTPPIATEPKEIRNTMHAWHQAPEHWTPASHQGVWVLQYYFSWPDPYTWLVRGSKRSKNNYHKLNTCLKEIGLARLRSWSTTTHSIVDTIGRT